MFYSLVSAATLLCTAALAVAAPARRTSHGIVLPSNGAVIAPGESFDFAYNTMGDYGISSYNVTVWLVTESPDSFAPSTNFATGHFFGRFSFPNYPGNPYPVNPAPSQLVMPDFANSPGGFGAGEAACNQSVFFVVLEEYSNGDGVLGNRMALSANQIWYNGTASTTSSNSK